MSLTLLAESQEEGDRREAIQRIREEMKVAETLVRIFGAKFVVETRSLMPVSDLFEQWMVDARYLLPDTSVNWAFEAKDAAVEVDPTVVRAALCDILVLAARKNSGHPLSVHVQPHVNQVRFSVTGPRTYSGICSEPGELAIWA